MNFKLCTFVFMAAMCCMSFARPATNTEYGDVVNIHPDASLSTTPVSSEPLEEFADAVNHAPTASLEEFAAAVKDAMKKAEVAHPSPKIPLDNTVTENDDDTTLTLPTADSNGRAGIQDPKFDNKQFNDILLNAVLDAVRKQVSNPDGSFDFMAIIKQLFDIWAKRFDHNNDGEVTIAEFAQWLIQFVKERLEQISKSI